MQTAVVGVVRSVLAKDPLSGTLFVFLNRRQTYVKAVYWDHTGFCLFAKRLERGRFRLPGDARTQDLSAQVFQLLLDGIKFGWRQQA